MDFAELINVAEIGEVNGRQEGRNRASFNRWNGVAATLCFRDVAIFQNGLKRMAEAIDIPELIFIAPCSVSHGFDIKSNLTKEPSEIASSAYRILVMRDSCANYRAYG